MKTVKLATPILTKLQSDQSLLKMLSTFIKSGLEGLALSYAVVTAFVWLNHPAAFYVGVLAFTYLLTLTGAILWHKKQV
jgi:hypothetical protein